jgi:hypothetical protein
MVAFVVRDMATHHFTILNGLAEIHVAPQCCGAFLAAVVCVLCAFSLCLTFFDAGASRPAALPSSLHQHALVNAPWLPLLLLCQLPPLRVHLGGELIISDFLSVQIFLPIMCPSM